MSDRPILFSGPMIQAILDGRKTQTRRVVKPQPHAGVRWDPIVVGGRHGWTDGHGRHLGGAYVNMRPGDRLWVRETWKVISVGMGSFIGVQYRADGRMEDRLYVPDADLRLGQAAWRPSLFMPRWASRLTLEVTDVRVERVQEISEVDAEREGFVKVPAMPIDPRDWYRVAWDSLNAHRGHGWDSNPWVWVVTFRRP